MSAAKMRAELRQLSKAAKDNLYRMLVVASELVADRDYVDTFGGEAQLMDSMEAEEFSHFGGTPSLGEMLAAYRANPSEKVWRDNRYNLRLMIDLANPANERGDVQRVNWKARCAELEVEVKGLQAAVAELRQSNAELRKDRDDSAGAASELRGRIQVLEQYAPRRAG